MGSEVAYCDCGTCGPLGAGADAGAVFPPGPRFNRSRTPPPPLMGGAVGGAPGVSWVGAPPVWMIDVGLRSKPAIQDNNRLVTKKPAARNAVVRVSTLAVPRPDMKPLVELTSPPPSDFCNSTTPIRPRTSMRWMTIMTLSIDDFRPPPALHIGSRGGLYMIRRGISMAEMARPIGGPWPARGQKPNRRGPSGTGVATPLALWGRT